MQIVVSVPVLPEEYAGQDYHTKIEKPGQCLCCRARDSFTGHGTYSRYVSGVTEISLSIHVRRFRCKVCNHTTSCLPEFAQPYRFINIHTLEGFLKGDVMRLDVRRNIALLRRYMLTLKRWVTRLKRIRKKTVSKTRRETPIRIYNRFATSEYTLATTSRFLVNRHHTTLFGDYRCHRLALAG